jgi:hypothetical protein
MCGSYYLTEEIKRSCIENNYILDDTFENVSRLNNLIGDLTGLYWVWKNTKDEFVGVNQYCRFYDDYELQNLKLDNNTIYVSNFVNFGNLSVWDQYTYWHTNVGIKMLYEVISTKKIPITESMANAMYFYNRLSTCNSFFSHRILFDKICNLIFDILFELYEGSKYTIEHIQHDMHKNKPNDKRLLAFLMERILNIIYHNVSYLLGNNIKIHPINFVYIP